MNCKACGFTCAGLGAVFLVGSMLLSYPLAGLSPLLLPVVSFFPLLPLVLAILGAALLVVSIICLAKKIPTEQEKLKAWLNEVATRFALVESYYKIIAFDYRVRECKQQLDEYNTYSTELPHKIKLNNGCSTCYNWVIE